MSPAPAVLDVDVEPSDDRGAGRPSFTVRLRNFTGPFDLLLQLISSRRLDVTEVALHQVTDDFLAHTRTLGADVGLEETTEFLVVAATLLDLKAARLLPRGEVTDVEDLALLEARDLLFARLLQHRAYQQVVRLFTELEAAALRSYPRSVSLEERFSGLLPEVLLGVDVRQLAEVAAVAFRPAPPPELVGVAHLHTARVSVTEQAGLLRTRLAGGGWTSFGALVEGCSTLLVVARFLAVLELTASAEVAVSQLEPLGELRVRLLADGEVVS